MCPPAEKDLMEVQSGCTKWRAAGEGGTAFSFLSVIGALSWLPLLVKLFP